MVRTEQQFPIFCSLSRKASLASSKIEQKIRVKKVISTQTSITKTNVWSAMHAPLDKTIIYMLFYRQHFCKQRPAEIGKKNHANGKQYL